MNDAELEERKSPIYKLTIRWGPDAIIFQGFFDNIPPNSAKVKQLIYIQSQILGTKETAGRVLYCLENIAGIENIIKQFPYCGGAIQFLWRDPETGKQLGSIQLTKLFVLKTEKYQD